MGTKRPIAVVGAWLGLGLLWSLVAGCPGRTPLELGETCLDASECAGGLCQDLGRGGLACTRTCTGAASCTAPFVCGTAGVCVHACSEGSVQGEGAARELCRAGVYTACTTLGESACSACGCEPFGGGVCIGGSRCVEPQPDGAACTTADECTSGACYADSLVCGAPRANDEPCAASSDCMSGLCLGEGTCGEPRPDGEPCADDAECAGGSCLSDGVCDSPRPMGEPCHVDADCTTSNCSTNGLETAMGRCYQALGTPCEHLSDTCDDCMNADTFSGGICGRRGCDPTDAPNCPQFRDHRFECEESVDPGDYYCYEVCERDPDTGETTDHGCYRRLDTCSFGGGYCR